DRSMSKSQSNERKVLARNRKATFNFEISDRFEAGIALQGSEVKSIRNGQVSLEEAFAAFDNSELFLQNCHVAEYPWANRDNHDPVRKRKLLLHKRELARLSEAISIAGFTLVPIQMYLKNGLIKVELGLGKGKKLHDKRDTLKKRDAQREIERSLSE